MKGFSKVKKNKTAFYLLLVYLIMQLSGLLFAPLLLTFFWSRMEWRTKAKLLEVVVDFFSMSLATLISIAILSRQTLFKNLKETKFDRCFYWLGCYWFLSCTIGQSLAAFIEGTLNKSRFWKYKDVCHHCQSSTSCHSIHSHICPILEELIFRRVILDHLSKPLISLCRFS
jgi:membrane protease YdiL (CAAX protease family)